jgi:hypothetical protein
MPLLVFWKSNPEIVSTMRLEQIVSNAGEGSLRDNTDCSRELRSYLAEITTDRLARYVDECLAASFSNSGSVLQDLVNELGRRLEYSVTNGRYQGTSNAIGFDGLWEGDDGHSLVVEVKTTDAYRVSLDKLAKYRTDLIRSEAISDTSSILIVVGRQDTGELEAQVRGSRHAWDVRLISTDALIKLVRLKENTDDPATADRIRSLLVPFEATKLDEIIEILFVTAKDVEQTTEAETVSSSIDETASADVRPHVSNIAELASKRDAILRALARREGTTLLKRSKATYWDAAHENRIVCTISKNYDAIERYWYAYHPQWDAFLGDAKTAFFVLGCSDLPIAFAIPLDVLRQHLEELNTTLRENGEMYWHVKILERTHGKYGLHLPRVSGELNLDNYAVRLDE